MCTVVGVKRRISTDSEYEDEDDEVVVKRVKVEPDSEDDGEVSGVRRIEKVTPSRGRGRPPGKLCSRVSLSSNGGLKENGWFYKSLF